MITNLYVLGDSLSDTGGFVLALSESLGNFKKIAMVEPYYKNSFSNGPVAAQILAQKLGFELNPGFNFKVFPGRICNLVGNNYAIGGSQIVKRIKSPFYQLFLNNLTIDEQSNALLTHHDLKKDDLIFLEIGGNDVIYALSLQTREEQENVINEAINIKEQVVKKLLSHGAKKILISNVADLGKIPRFVETDKSYRATQLSVLFNEKLIAMIKKLKVLFPNYINHFNLFKIFRNLLNEFSTKSNSNITVGYYDEEIDFFKIIKESKMSINTTLKTNKDISNYFFFDSVHPTKGVHEKIANELFIITKRWYLNE